MANSSVVINDVTLATGDTYNNLRLDVLDPTTGHAHTGAADGGKLVDYATAGAGAVVAGLATAVEKGIDNLHQTTLTFLLSAANDLDLADGADHGTGVKVYAFPAGNIYILGATMNGILQVSDSFNAHAEDTLDLACGSVVGADDATLTGTEANIIPSTTIDTVGAAVVDGAWHATLAAPILFANAGGADLDLYVNAAVEDAHTDAAVTIAITGTLTITWINLGDY
jgi:hypothetical protein